MAQCQQTVCVGKTYNCVEGGVAAAIHPCVGPCVFHAVSCCFLCCLPQVAPLSWDEGLAQQAASFLADCPLKHSTVRNIGESLGW